MEKQTTCLFKPEAWTTYRDAKHRKWVVTQLFYEKQNDAEVMVGANLYLVDSHQQFQYVELQQFEELVSKKVFIKVV